MKITLTTEEKATLERQHKLERDSRVSDRIKAVLARSEGNRYSKIAHFLVVDTETVRRHIKDYLADKKLKSTSGGSSSKLNEAQGEALIQHIRENLYTKVVDICAYVEKKYGIKYSRQGMTAWLNEHNFSYKKPKGVPAKADPTQQKAFMETYAELKATVPKEEPILFIDSVHPTMGSKLGYGWIYKGEEKVIPTTASRTRMNIIGAICLSDMEVEQESYKTIDGEAIISFLQTLREKYTESPLIHIILDQAGYHRSAQVQAFSEKHNIKLHYLPPYSPNLNPIERLWKVMNEYVRNNRYFSTAKEFREKINEFFKVTIREIAPSLKSRINDNFQVLKIAF